ncbi:MAG: type IV pilus biogenesis protein PilP [Pseudomonadota bacterium]
MQVDKNKMLKIITVVFALVAIGTIAFAYWQLKVINDSPVANVPLQAPPKVQETKVASKPESTPFVWPDSSKATIGALTQKQAQFEELKLDVSIAEQENKLRMLNKNPEEAMPTLVLPPASLPPVEKVESAPVKAAQPTEPTLLAIHGVDGDLIAVFSTPKGKSSVRVGDAILHSKVREITLDAVTLTNGKVLQLGQDN